MPFYEYECQACGHYLETLQKLSEPPLTDCPACGKPALKKLMSASGFRLKGAGWYETDFKNKDKKKNLHESGSGEKGGGDKGGETKVDTKAHDKTDGKADTGTKADKPAPEKPAVKTKTPKDD
jgi:putative FmdB family regulatory protein